MADLGNIGLMIPIHHMSFTYLQQPNQVVGNLTSHPTDYFNNTAIVYIKEYAGNYSITGTILINGIAGKRLVKLYNNTGTMIDYIMSDPNTGAFYFHNLTNTKTYSVIAFDYLNNQYKPVSRINITPT